MSIVDALNDLSGKSATTIDEAIGNIDLGGGSSPLCITQDFDLTTLTAVLDKTWQEINESYPNAYLYMTQNDGSMVKIPVLGVSITDGKYRVGFTLGGEAITYIAESADDYPSWSEPTG